jgi:hypothetical protein
MHQMMRVYNLMMVVHMHQVVLLLHVAPSTAYNIQHTACHGLPSDLSN